MSTAVAAVALCATAPAASAQQWIDGNIAYASGLSCGGPLVGNYTENQVGGFTGYWGKTDVTYPKIGDLYWGRVYYQALGLGCDLGVHGVQVEISLPAGTSLAIDPNSSDPAHKIRCYGYAPNGQSYGEVTGQSWNHPANPSINGKYCEPTSTYQGANGTILSYALVGQGQALEIIFPLRSTRKLSGISEPNNASRMTATITDSNASGAARPFQWNFVGDRPVEPDCPAAGTTAASAITDTTAHTRNFMCNWYRSGKVSIEIGEGASGPYQASSQEYNVPASTQAFFVDQDWGSLIPGTTYHWRLKFVDDKGTTTTADDQTHYSQPKTFTTTGTRPANPPTSTPGAGAGGGQSGGDTGGSGSGTPGTQTPSTQTPGGGTGGEQQQQQIQQEQQQQQEQGPRDAVAPALSATVGKLKLRDLLKKGLRATATCSEACTVQAQLQVDRKTAKKLKLGKKATTIGKGRAISPGGKVAVPVKLTSKAKKRLKKLRSLKATLVLTATDSAGNKSKPVKRKLSLKR